MAKELSEIDKLKLENMMLQRQVLELQSKLMDMEHKRLGAEMDAIAKTYQEPAEEKPKSKK